MLLLDFSDYKIDVLEVIFSRTNFAQIQIDTRAKTHPPQPISRFYAVYICRANRATIKKTRRPVSFKITQATNQDCVLCRVFHHARALARRWRGGPIMLQLTARPKATPHNGMCLNWRSVKLIPIMMKGIIWGLFASHPTPICSNMLLP